MNFKCLLKGHDDEFLYSINNYHQQIFKCKRCGSYLHFDKFIDCGYRTRGKPLLPIPDTGRGDMSDGYHTFNDLYDHRAKLFSFVCNSNKQNAWKSKLHDDGTMYDGMFIVGIETPEGMATYHYDINPYWDYFHVNEVAMAPKWDGHTTDDAINRILKFGMSL